MLLIFYYTHLFEVSHILTRGVLLQISRSRGFAFFFLTNLFLMGFLLWARIPALQMSADIIGVRIQPGMSNMQPYARNRKHPL